ncbi:MAG: hypothetical protein ACF8SC_08710 [Phycisphaerales bacterium JB037]
MRGNATSKRNLVRGLSFAGLMIGVAVVLAPTGDRQAQSLAWMTILLGYAATERRGTGCCLGRRRAPAKVG